ncbi:hypothetical protein NUSPORA_02085 [Nucleospora cyclopteri]
MIKTFSYLKIIIGAEGIESFITQPESIYCFENPSLHLNPANLSNLCIKNLKSELNLKINNMFKNMFASYERRLEVEKQELNELIAEIKSISSQVEETFISGIVKCVSDFMNDSLLMKKAISLKKKSLLKIFNQTLDELENTVCFNEYNFLNYLIKFQNITKNVKEEIPNLKKLKEIDKPKSLKRKMDDIQPEITVELTSKIQDLKLVVTSESISNIDSKCLDVRPKTKSVTSTLSSTTESEVQIVKTAIPRLQKSLKQGETSETKTAAVKQKTDPFILFLIDLCKNLGDAETRKRIINSIIKEKSLDSNDMEILIKENNLRFVDEETKNPSFLDKIMVQSRINRCNKGITVQLNKWQKIKNKLSDDLADKVFNLDMCTTINFDKYLPYTHLISESLSIDHKTGTTTLGPHIMQRLDLFKHIPNKNFDPYDTNTFTNLPIECMKNLKDTDINIKPFSHRFVLFLIKEFASRSQNVTFFQILSVGNRTSILGCSFGTESSKIIFIPEKQIILCNAKITELFLLYIYKKK